MVDPNLAPFGQMGELALPQLSCNDLAMAIGDIIKAARERAQLTQGQLAEAVGVSLRSVGNWERGETVSRNRIAKIEEVLGVSLSEQPQPARGAGMKAGPIDAWSTDELLAEIGRRVDHLQRQLHHGDRYSADEVTEDPGIVAAVDQIKADVAAREKTRSKATTE